MTLTPYIALYSTGAESKFHWAFVVPGPDGLGGSVPTYEIKMNVTWKKVPGSYKLTASGTFLGLVRLPDFHSTVTAQQVHDYFESTEVTATQGNTTLPMSHETWSCAVWIMRELHNLQTKGYGEFGIATWPKDAWNHPAFHFYGKVIKAGNAMYKDSNVGVKHSGVRVVNISDY